METSATQKRSFKTREAERAFYDTLERYEATFSTAGSARLIDAIKRRWDRHRLASRLRASARADLT